MKALLTLILLTWTIWRAPTNASKWRMGFNSAFKGLKYKLSYLHTEDIVKFDVLRLVTACHVPFLELKTFICKIWSYILIRYYFYIHFMNSSASIFNFYAACFFPE